MFKLNDQVAIVTGGSRGIGAGIGDVFCRAGATVILWDILDGESTAAALREKGHQATFRKVDITEDKSVKQAVAAVIKEHGKIDILINNAGITRDTLILRMSEDQWDSVMNNNLKSIFNLTKHSLRPLMKSGEGSVINMSSIVGVTGQAGQANYAASKAGIIGFSKSLAKEMGSRNLRCNVIAPGFIQTDMTDELPEELKQSYLNNIPLKRLGQADEIAKACVFLASDLSSYVNGQVLGVDGGLS